MFIILIPLSELVFALFCMLLVAAAISIDGGSIIQTVIANHATGLFVVNLLLCMLFLLILCIFYYRKNENTNCSKTVAITNFCCFVYKTILVAIYFFVCNCFIVIPQITRGNLLEILFNTIGSIFFTVLVLAILLVMWCIVYGIQYFIERIIFRGKTYNSAIANFLVKGVTNILYILIFYQWIMVKELPWMFSQTPIGLLKDLYGDSIIYFLENYILL